MYVCVCKMFFVYMCVCVYACIWCIFMHVDCVCVCVCKIFFCVLSQPPVMIIGFGMAILAILSGGLALARSWVGHHDTRTMLSALNVVGAAAIIGLVPGVFGGDGTSAIQGFCKPARFLLDGECVVRCSLDGCRCSRVRYHGRCSI